MRSNSDGQFCSNTTGPDPDSMGYIRRRAPIAQLAEAADLKSVQCRFESDWGHRVRADQIDSEGVVSSLSAGAVRRASAAV